jgi:hypothetical protein
MLKAATWCAKCLFLYFLVAILAIRYSWIFTTPVFQIATRFHWTQRTQFIFVLSYFLQIFAAAGFLFGLIPFGKLGKALTDLYHSFFASSRIKIPAELDGPTQAPPILWAWLPVTFAFLIRFITWQSRNSSVLDPHRSVGRFERFFGPLYAQTSGLLDSKWIIDRFLFTGPMLFLMAAAIAAWLRYRLTARPTTPQTISEVEP